MYKTNIRRYLVVEPGSNYYSGIFNPGSRFLIKIQDGYIIEPINISLEEMELSEWLEKYPNKLTYEGTIGGWSLDRRDKTIKVQIPIYRKGKVIKEVLLDGDELFNLNSEVEDDVYFRDIRQYNDLIKNLENTFNIVEPSIKHKNVFGLKYRELILLASMEIEIHWKALLVENAYEHKERTTTKDYIKLQNFIKFDPIFQLKAYPTYTEIIPFENWNEDSPTKSLNWYNAYNKIKHNRTDNLELANFQNTINALCALKWLLHIRYSSRNPENIIKDNIFSSANKNQKHKYGFNLNFISISKDYKYTFVKYFERYEN